MPCIGSATCDTKTLGLMPIPGVMKIHPATNHHQCMINCGFFMPMCLSMPVISGTLNALALFIIIPMAHDTWSAINNSSRFQSPTKLISSTKAPCAWAAYQGPSQEFLEVITPLRQPCPSQIIIFYKVFKTIPGFIF